MSAKWASLRYKAQVFVLCNLGYRAESLLLQNKNGHYEKPTAWMPVARMLPREPIFRLAMTGSDHCGEISIGTGKRPTAAVAAP